MSVQVLLDPASARVDTNEILRCGAVPYAGTPAASAFMAAVVSALPAMPQSAGNFFDDDPGHRTHVLAFDCHHGVGQPLDDLALLIGRERRSR